jgi:hypothetical protein
MAKTNLENIRSMIKTNLKDMYKFVDKGQLRSIILYIPSARNLPAGTKPPFRNRPGQTKPVVRNRPAVTEPPCRNRPAL